MKIKLASLALFCLLATGLFAQKLSFPLVGDTSKVPYDIGADIHFQKKFFVGASQVGITSAGFQKRENLFNVTIDEINSILTYQQFLERNKSKKKDPDVIVLIISDGKINGVKYSTKK